MQETIEIHNNNNNDNDNNNNNKIITKMDKIYNDDEGNNKWKQSHTISQYIIIIIIIHTHTHTHARAYIYEHFSELFHSNLP